MASPARPRAQLTALLTAAALVLVVLGAIVWGRLVSDDGASADDEVRLDTPGEYLEPGGPTNPPLPTDELPDVELVAADGTAVRLGGADDVAGDGRPTVINLWYSTCPPCARELADFAAVDAELGDRVRFVGINPFDTPSAMERFAADRGVDYELLRDPEFAFADELGIVAYPVTLFVDADGRILGRTGPIDADELRDEIAELFGVAA